MSQPLAAGLAVALVSLAAILGPALGLSPWWITLGVALGLGSLTLDAARFGGRGGHVLAEALPGGQLRLRRIAIHEAGHVLVARQEAMAVRHQIGVVFQSPALDPQLTVAENLRWAGNLYGLRGGELVVRARAAAEALG